MSDEDLARLAYTLDLVTHMHPKMHPEPTSPGVVPLDHYSGLFLDRGVVPSGPVGARSPNVGPPSTPERQRMALARRRRRPPARPQRAAFERSAPQRARDPTRFPGRVANKAARSGAPPSSRCSTSASTPSATRWLDLEPGELTAQPRTEGPTRGAVIALTAWARGFAAPERDAGKDRPTLEHTRRERSESLPRCCRRGSPSRPAPGRRTAETSAPAQRCKRPR
jgi:hypothetical protein